VRDAVKKGESDADLCDFYEGFDKAGTDAVLPAAVYTLENLKVVRRRRRGCSEAV
jgi:hypothetical protein